MRFLHVSAGAVQLFVQFLSWPLLRRQRGHDKTWVLLALQVLGFGNDPALPAPTAAHRLVRELAEHPRWLLGLFAVALGLGHLWRDDLPQLGVVGKSQPILHSLLLAPMH